jgi:transposase
MDFKQFLHDSLNFGPDWVISNASVDKSNEITVLELEYIDNGKLPQCPQCSGACLAIHDRRRHRYRHLDMFQNMTYIDVNVPRLKCENGHISHMPISWAAKGSRFTLLFESMVLFLCASCPVNVIAKKARVQDKAIWRIIERYVQRYIDKLDLSNVKRIGIDETSRRKNHQYISVFMDIDTRRVIGVFNGKGKDVISSFVKHFKERGGDVNYVEDISCDMSRAFISGIKTEFPSARITIDRFHISKLLNEVVNDVRKRERASQPCLNGAMYALLKNPNNLKPHERESLSEINKLNIKTAKAYKFKLLFADFFRQKDATSAKGFLKGWVTAALRSGIEQIKNAGETIMRHWQYIANWHASKINNALLEGFNSILQALKAGARGYRTLSYITNIAYLIGTKSLRPSPTST